MYFVAKVFFVLREAIYSIVFTDILESIRYNNAIG